MKRRIRNKLNHSVLTLTILCVIVLAGCKNDYYPKPKGYFRIDLPEKIYIKFDFSYPYSFEYPVYAKVLPDNHPQAEKYWINITYPQFNGTLHLSYKIIDGNLDKYLEDTRTMVMKHIPKASSIENQQYRNEISKVYGLTYTISGVAAASPYQFYLTDSTDHFVRGALYFNTVPNNDSLAPVIEFLKEDINHMIETFEWK
jgi:gliding motility-associated lipoprotein GldD